MAGLIAIKTTTRMKFFFWDDGSKTMEYCKTKNNKKDPELMEDLRKEPEEPEIIIHPGGSMSVVCRNKNCTGYDKTSLRRINNKKLKRWYHARSYRCRRCGYIYQKY